MENMVCRFFASPEGCRFGRRCIFPHVKSKNRKPDTVCRFHLVGQCRFGNSCWNDHVSLMDLNVKVVMTWDNQDNCEDLNLEKYFKHCQTVGVYYPEEIFYSGQYVFTDSDLFQLQLAASLTNSYGNQANDSEGNCSKDIAVDDTEFFQDNCSSDGMQPDDAVRLVSHDSYLNVETVDTFLDFAAPNSANQECDSTDDDLKTYCYYCEEYLCPPTSIEEGSINENANCIPESRSRSKKNSGDANKRNRVFYSKKFKEYNHCKNSFCDEYCTRHDRWVKKFDSCDKGNDTATDNNRKRRYSNLNNENLDSDEEHSSDNYARMSDNRCSLKGDRKCTFCREFVAKQALYGVLENCDHLFCLKCIFWWKSVLQTQNDFDGDEIHAACPKCQGSSRFIIPTYVWPESFHKKSGLIERYLRFLNNFK